MTPLQVIMLAHRMREAQKAWPSHPQQQNIEVAALEQEFEEAIQPYLAYAKSFELEEVDNG